MYVHAHVYVYVFVYAHVYAYAYATLGGKSNINLNASAPVLEPGTNESNTKSWTLIRWEPKSQNSACRTGLVAARTIAFICTITLI